MPDFISLVDRLRKALHRSHLFKPIWEKDYLIKQAMEKSGGLNNWGDRAFIEGLEVLLSSIRELKTIHLIGEITLYCLILGSLKNRLHFIHYTRARGFKHWPLKPPVIITGLPRSATTYLHRLLSSNGELYAFPLWELLAPYPPPANVDLRQIKTEFQLHIKNLLLPELDKKHYSRAKTTEECIMLLANSFNSQLFTDIGPFEGYLEWLINTDRVNAYKEYRDQLKILQSFHPDRRFVLKAPNHLGNLNELLKVIPEAIVIQTHRPPEECSSSLISLKQSLYKMVTSEINHDTIRGITFKLMDNEIKRNLVFHQNKPKQVFPISYHSIVTKPLATLREIYERIPLSWTKKTEESAKLYMQQNLKNRRNHHYKVFFAENEMPRSFHDYKSYFGAYL